MEEFNALITQLQDVTNVFTAQDLILTLVLSCHSQKPVPLVHRMSGAARSPRLARRPKRVATIVVLRLYHSVTY